jgi:hypothetical protein
MLWDRVVLWIVAHISLQTEAEGSIQISTRCPDDEDYYSLYCSKNFQSYKTNKLLECWRI